MMAAFIHLRVGPDARRRHIEGLSLQLLDGRDPAPIFDPATVGWAVSRPKIAHAFAQWHALMLDVELRLPMSAATKAYLRSLIWPTEVPELPAHEKPIREFARQIILEPTTLSSIPTDAPLRRLFASDTEWVEFVGWCSYLASLAVEDHG